MKASSLTLVTVPPASPTVSSVLPQMIPLSTLPTISNVSSSPATFKYLHQELHQSSCPCFNSWSITNTLSHQEFIISMLPPPSFSIPLLDLFHNNCFIISAMICCTGLSLSTPSFVSSTFPHVSSMSLPQPLVSPFLTFNICYINISITIFLIDLTQPFAISKYLSILTSASSPKTASSALQMSPSRSLLSASS